MTAVLEFQNVVRAFGVGARVLDGAGKTTLIRIAMGMLFPQEGAVKVFGLSPMAEPVAVKRRVGYVAEDQVLPPSATVGGPARLSSLTVSVVGQRARTAID